MRLVQYFRGPRNLYSLEAHGQGIYFATDTHEIIHNDVAYSGVLPAELAEVIKSVDEINKELDILTGGEGSSIQASINNAINDFAEKISDDGTINTFKELVDYASEHKEESAQLVLDVAEIQLKNEAQDSLIVQLQEKDSALELQITTIAEDLSLEIDEKINNAFSWINV